MSSIYTGSQSAVVANGESLPPSDTLVRGEAPARLRTSPESKLFLAFHYVLMSYLFLYISRLPELISWLRIGLILQPILLVGLIMTKKVRVLLEVRSGLWLIGFTLWVAICIPLSFWPGGSFWALVRTLQSLLLVAFILAFVRSVSDVMRGLSVIGLASGTIAILSFLSSADIDNRQGLGGSASLADPSYFALYLLVGLALLCLTASQTRGWLRLGALALIPINLAAIARSGSRAGLIAFGAGLIMMLVYGSVKQRTILLWACVIGFLVAVFLLPANIKLRFTNWLSPTGFSTLLTGERTQEFDVDRGVVTATASTESRLYLLRRSLIMTAKHPLFGVGTDQFMGAEAEDAEAHGNRGAWRYPHNTYTEISSEMGIPGFILFTGARFGSYRGLSGIRKRGPTRHIRQMALFLQTAYFMLLFGAFFLSFGYGGLPFVVVGLSAAMQLAVRRYAKETHIQIRQPQL